MTAHVTADCQACDQSTIGHLQCAACLIFAGPGHYDVTLMGGLCETCRARDNLFVPTDLDIASRKKRAEALALFEERGHISAVTWAYRIPKGRAKKWLTKARRERAMA